MNMLVTTMKIHIPIIGHRVIETKTEQHAECFTQHHNSSRAPDNSHRSAPATAAAVPNIPGVEDEHITLKQGNSVAAKQLRSKGTHHLPSTTTTSSSTAPAATSSATAATPATSTALVGHMKVSSVLAGLDETTDHFCILSQHNNAVGICTTVLISYDIHFCASVEFAGL
jgi:hypothetical protein